MVSRTKVETARNKGERLKIRSALFPMIFLCAIVGIPAIIALGWAPHPAVAISIALYAVVGVTLAAFVYLLLMDRDRLQSRVLLQDRPTLDVHDGENAARAE